MKSKLRFSLASFILAVLMTASLQPLLAADRLADKLSLIDLPPGFEISVYAEDVENARQLALGQHGTVFAGSHKAGKVHAVTDTDSDHKADQVYLVDQGLDMPSGLEFRSGSLYVGALDRILRYDEIESRLDQPPEPVVVSDAFPDKTHHGWKYLRFGPDGLLYVPVGAPCNICDEPGFAQIRRLRADGGGMEVYAEGVRNSVGMAFHPRSGDLWFTDNGRDLLGDDLPGDELNHAPQSGLHFGYPWCHQGDSLDPEFGVGKSCSDYEAPALFIAQHGSWNRSKKVGYNVLLVRFDGHGAVTGSEVFASGWLQGQDNWGRPNDVLQMPDGSLLVADDQANAIYRISYAGRAE